MRKTFFYLVSAALLLSTVSTFTSCSDDEPYPQEQPGDNNNNGNDNDEGGDEKINLNGTYSANASGDGTLTMIYNGGELTGKKVSFIANEELTSATIELSGDVLDLTNMIGGLLPWSVETYSPVPGVKAVTLSEVKLTTDEKGVVSFSGTKTDSTFTLDYEGTIVKDKSGKKTMTINLNNKLVNDQLCGTWNLAEKGDLTPLWLDVDSEVDMKIFVDLFGTGTKSEIKGPIMSIFGLALTSMGDAIIDVNGAKGIQGVVKALFQGVINDINGNMKVSYAWNDDWANPEYSTNLPANSIRYYYKDDKIYVEINPNLILNLISGVMTSASRAAGPENAIEIGKKLIEILNPILAEGLPIQYELDGDKLKVNIDEQTMLNLLHVLADLIQDEYVSGFIFELIPTLGLGEDITPILTDLLKQLPYVVKYHDGKAYDEVENPGSGNLSGECGYFKIGFKMVKATDAAN